MLVADGGGGGTSKGWEYDGYAAAAAQSRSVIVSICWGCCWPGAGARSSKGY